MKRICAIVGLVLILLLIAGIPSSHAQVPPTPTPMVDADQLMRMAQDTLTSAQQATQQAGQVLSFIQGIAILGSVLAAVAGILLGLTGIRTLNEYQTDLARSRTELEKMRDQLSEATQRAAQSQAELEQSNDRQLQEFRTQAMEQIGLLRSQAQRTYRALALLQLGEDQFEIGNVQAALRIYQEAHELDPDNRAANYVLGELYTIERNLPEATKHLEWALAQDPNLAPAHAALGYVRRLQGDQIDDPSQRNQLYAEAEQRLLKALAIDPSVRDANKQSVFGTLGALYRRQGRLRDAIYYYLEAEKLTPNSSYPVNNLAQLYFMQSDLEKAEIYFERSTTFAQRALTQNPFDTWARFDLATAKAALGNSDGAQQELRSALTQASVGPIETLLSGLRNLKEAPTPPAGIDSVIHLVETALAARKATI